MQNSERMVSVVVPIYNGEKYIDSFYEMLNCQLYNNFEVIFINDGSVDRTSLKLDGIKNKDTRVRIISKKNEGVSIARNIGVKNANGDYIIFVDIDDYIYPDYISHLVYLIEKYNVDVSVGNYYKLRPDESIPNIDNNFDAIVYDRHEAIKDVLYRRKLNGYPYLKLIKKEIAEKVYFKEGIAYGEDTLYVLDVLTHVEKIVYSTKVIYLYYQRPDSVNHTMRYEKIEKSWNAICDLFESQDFIQDNEYRLALISKAYMFALDFSSRLVNINRSEVTGCKIDLLEFIRKNSFEVLADKRNKKSMRLAAFLGMLNPRLLIRLVFIARKVGGLFGVQARKSH